MRLVGFAWVAFAAVCYGLLGVFTLLAYEHDANVSGVTIARTLAMVPLLVVFAIPGGAARRANVQAGWRPLLAMALMFTTMVGTYMIAVSRMSPALVTLIIYTYSILAVLGSRAFGWSRLGRLALVAAALTVGGSAITIGFPAGSSDPIAIALAMVNAVATALYFLFAQVALRTCDPLTTSAAASGAAGVLLFACAFLIDQPAWPSGRTGLAAAVCVGLVSTLIANIALLRGIGHLGGASAAVVSTTDIVVVITTMAFVFDQPITTGLVVGAVSIAAGAALAPVALIPSTSRQRHDLRDDRSCSAGKRPSDRLPF